VEELEALKTKQKREANRCVLLFVSHKILKNKGTHHSLAVFFWQPKRKLAQFKCCMQVISNCRAAHDDPGKLIERKKENRVKVGGCT